MTLSLCIVTILLLSACGTENKSLKVPNEAEFQQDDYQKIVPSNNELAFQLLQVVEENEEGNVFISPTSLLMALAMVYNGADGETKEEIAKVLHTTLEPKEFNQANASLMDMLYQNSDEITLEVANSIWLNESYQFQEKFKENTMNYFNAKTEEIDITNPESVNRINDWVKKVTHGKIDEIVENPLDPDLVTILINAIYFNGAWTYPFNPELTESRTFTLEDGSKKETPFMIETRDWYYFENETFQAICLPYGDNQNMSMKIFLPKENSDLHEFRSILTMENWNKWNQAFNRIEGTLLLPKFQLTYETELNETLKQLGMKSAFQKGADFTKMIQEDIPIWISKVKQKTYIDVNEKGTEAAAATSVEIVTEMAVDQPFFMEVNRPFFITITEDITGTILFTGFITNPIIES